MPYSFKVPSGIAASGALFPTTRIVLKPAWVTTPLWITTDISTIVGFATVAPSGHVDARVDPVDVVRPDYALNRAACRVCLVASVCEREDGERARLVLGGQ